MSSHLLRSFQISFQMLESAELFGRYFAWLKVSVTLYLVDEKEACFFIVVKFVYFLDSWISD